VTGSDSDPIPARAGRGSGNTSPYETKADRAIRLLREKINSGSIVPGERISLQAIADELEMSPTPVREALRVLQADRLVNYRPHLGVEVAQFPPAEVEEIYMLREKLEPIAVELAVPKLQGVELEHLEDLHSNLITAVASGHGRTTGEANAAWHWAIYDLSGTTYLIEFIRRLWDRFPWRTMWVVPQRSASTQAEHESVMEAIRAGDHELAAERLRMHIASGRSSIGGDDALARVGGAPGAESE
jgi:DNA-binding GntR family transcriptional regulator